jgi:protein-arginine kinase activator protein McsA
MKSSAEDLISRLNLMKNHRTIDNFVLIKFPLCRPGDKTYKLDWKLLKKASVEKSSIPFDIEQVKCKICGKTSPSHGSKRQQKTKYLCPHCSRALSRWKQSKQSTIYKCFS